MKKHWFKNIETGEERLLTLEDAKRELDDKWVRGRVIDEEKNMEKFYIYKLTFRNGCTYIGKHHQKKDFDQYITSSSYYKKHKDLLEKREIILEVKDIETLDIMETICILGDAAENTLNVNYNYGAWLNKSKFDRGYTGASNGMFGKKQSDLARNEDES